MHRPTADSLQRISTAIWQNLEESRDSRFQRISRTLIQRRIIPQQRQNIDHHETKAGQSDEVGCHRHGKALDHDVCIERLEDIARQERVVNAAVFVFLEARKLFLANIDHVGGWRLAAAMADGGEVLLKKEFGDLFVVLESRPKS